MTPFVPFPDGAQVFIRWSLFGDPCSNRLWFLNRQPPNTTTQLDALASGVADWCSAQLLPLLSYELTLVSIEAADWTADPPPYTSVAPVALPGGSSASSYSANVSDRVVFRGSTAQHWPNNSHFIPGIPEDVISANVIAPVFRAGVFEAYVALIDLAPSFGPFPAWRWVVASSISAGALRSELAIARMDFVQFASPYSTQRRRRIVP